MDYGTVTFEGVTYTLTQQAYVDNYGTDGGVRYYARAIDEAGNGYKIAWDTTLAWDASSYIAQCDLRGIAVDPDTLAGFGVDPDFVPYSLEDESDACDWDSPVAVVPND